MENIVVKELWLIDEFGEQLKRIEKKMEKWGWDNSTVGIQNRTNEKFGGLKVQLSIF